MADSLGMNDKINTILSHMKLDDVCADDGLSVHANLPPLSEISLDAASGDPAVQLQALRCARIYTSASACNPTANEDLIKTGILPSLVLCLNQDDNPAVQLEALWVLANIASATLAQTLAVVESGAVPFVILLLCSPDRHVGERAAVALNTIVDDNAQCRDYVIQLGAVEPLLRLLDEELSLFHLRRVVRTFACLLGGKDVPPPPKDTVLKLLPALCTLVSHNDTEITTNSLWGFACLAGAGNPYLQLVLNSGILPKLVELLSSSDVSVQTAALRTVGNLMMGTDDQTQRVLDCNVLPHFHNLLAHHDEAVNRDAIWLLSNITAGSRDQVQQVIDSGLIPLVVQHLAKSGIVIQKEAAWVISNMLYSKGDRQLVADLVMAGAVPPLCNMLAVSDAQVLAIVLDGVRDVLRLAGELCPEVVTHVRQCGGLYRVHALVSCGDADIREKALHIIRTYFSDDSADHMVQQQSSNGREEFVAASFLSHLREILCFYQARWFIPLMWNADGGLKYTVCRALNANMTVCEVTRVSAYHLADSAIVS